MDPTAYEALKLKVDESRLLRIKDGRLQHKDFHKWKLVICQPNHEEIIRSLHEGNTAAHRGINATTSRIKERYWWPNVKDDVRDFIKTCDRCQKNRKPKPATDIYPTMDAERPMQIIGIDHVGPFAETKHGFRHIIVAQDYFTKYPFAVPVYSTDTDEAVEFLWDNICTYFGIPEQVITDRGTAFTSQHWRDCMKRWGIRHTPTNTANPQANGQVERFNQTLKNGLKKRLGAKKTKWDRHISTILFDYRTTVQATTGMTPISLMCGYQPRLPIEAKYPVPIERYGNTMQARKDALRELHHTRIKIAAKIRRKQAKVKERFEANKEPATPFKVQDQVLLHKPAGKTNLHQVMEGPYRIKEVLPRRQYIIETMGGVAKRDKVSGRRLTKYYDRSNARIDI
jgi:transposase InsO family protein